MNKKQAIAFKNQLRNEISKLQEHYEDEYNQNGVTRASEYFLVQIKTLSIVFETFTLATK